ncbi:MAG: 3-isopropylmalate dehydrogenase [Chloroflexota bacterium]
MTTLRIALLPGDGIGPEVTDAAVRVLNAVLDDDLSIEYDHLLVGGAAIDAYGIPLRREDLQKCRDADAVLLGAVGGPAWDHLSQMKRPERALLQLRSELSLGINLRPVQFLPACADRSPIRPEIGKDSDIAFIRELTGGVYFGQPSYYHRTLSGKYVVDTGEYTERQVLAVMEFAFELARRRGGKVTSVDKANVMSTSRLWRDVATEFGRQHPDIELEHALVDSFAMSLIQNPRNYDVVVTENLFGDILTDLASVIVGSLGVLPSASLRPTPFGKRFGMYEPVHGSAPGIQGQGIANPVGAILSMALMLEWSLGRPSLAWIVRDAVRTVMESKRLTPDLARDESRGLGTVEFTEAVIGEIGDARGREALRHHVA